MNYLPIHNKIVTEQEFVRIIHQWQAQGDKVVFSNGCFDLLHMGHTQYLEKSRMLGDRLVLGLNTDRSVQKIKGTSRPIQNEQSRQHVVASLAFVDLVTLFDESTPKRLIGIVKPDILVKGDDYQVGNIVGADIVEENGGKVETIPLVKGFSTTAIIKKIKEN